MKTKPATEAFKVIPEGNRVIVKELPRKVERTLQGIIIPNADKQAPIAEVVAIGGEYKGQVKVGDKVFYQDHSGFPFTNDGFDYRILYALEILAIDKR
jgi:co-chaperonin GroES (HSP10)